MMKHQVQGVALAALSILFVSSVIAADSGAPALYLDVSQPVEKRVADLISRLTLEEKATLLNHRGPTVERFNIRSDGNRFRFHWGCGWQHVWFRHLRTLQQLQKILHALRSFGGIFGQARRHRIFPNRRNGIVFNA